MDTALSEKGSLIIYLDKVRHQFCPSQILPPLLSSGLFRFRFVVIATLFDVNKVQCIFLLLKFAKLKLLAKNQWGFVLFVARCPQVKF